MYYSLYIFKVFLVVDKIWAGDLYGRLQCKRPYRSDVNILISYLWNEYIKLNAKYRYAIRSLDMHAKMPYTSDANSFTYLQNENTKFYSF